RRKAREHILVRIGARQRPDHDEGEQRDQRQAQDDAELFGGHREHEISMAVRQAAFCNPLAGSEAEPAAVPECLHRHVDLKDVAGISGRLVDSANSHAAITTKAGLADSEAWMLTPSNVIQRREPFTSAPKASVATIKRMLTTKTSSARRRICFGDRNDTAISTMKDASRNSTCRPKKWKGSSPIRVATGGLAASHRM